MFRLREINNTISFLNLCKEIGGTLKYTYTNKKCEIQGTTVEANYIHEDEIIEFSEKNNMKFGYTYNMWFGRITIASTFDNKILFDKSIIKYFNPIYYLAKFSQK